MYTEFYGFREKPFSLVPDPGFLYPSSKHRMALTYLEYALMDGIGFVLLTGEIGAGKTTIIRKLLSQVGSDIEVAVVMGRKILTLREGSNQRPHILKNNYAAMIDNRNQTTFQNQCDELRKHLETVA